MACICTPRCADPQTGVLFATRMILLLLLIFLLPCSGKQIPDNLGKEFILGFMEATNAISGKSSVVPLKLFVTTSSQTTVSVSITAPLARNSYPGENITVTKGVVKQVTLPKSLRLDGTERSNKAVYIMSSEEIVVFGINQAFKSTDGFLGIPVDVLGMQYFVPSFFSSSESFFKSAIVIAGTQSGTELSIRIKSTNSGVIDFEGKRHRNGDWLNTTIDRFETVQLLCRGDLTGTFVQSSQKVSVFGGSTITNIGAGTSKDHIEEQIPPVNVWGKRFAVSPVPDTDPNLIRVLASEDHTVVSVNNAVVGTLRRREFYETNVNAGSLFTADKPILTVQYIPSGTCPYGNIIPGCHRGDPAMTLVPPIEQSNVKYTFLTPKASDNSEGLMLDNNPVNDFFNIVHKSNITIGYVKIPPGSHTLGHSAGSVPFGGILYGGILLESYAFPVGQRFTPINQDCLPSMMKVGDGFDNDCDGNVDEEVCNDFKDNDADGKTDEDCVIELSTTRPSTKSTTTTTTTTPKPAAPAAPKPTITTTKPTTTTAKPKTTTVKPKTTVTTTTTRAKPTTTTSTTTSTTKPTSLTAIPTITTKQMTTVKTFTPKTTPTFEIDLDQIRPLWLTWTEFGVIGGVAVVLVGVLGICCKQCWGLIKNRDDDDEEDEERKRRRRNKARLAIGAPSIRPMYM